MEIDSQAEAVLANIRNRRTLAYTKMKPDPILEEHMHLILESANWAPSHKHNEPWRFHIFEGEGRNQISQLLAKTYKTTAGEKFMARKYQKALMRPPSVGAVIAIIMRPGTKPVLPEFEEILAVGCAVQNLHLAAQALGVGCSWSTPAYLNHTNLRDFFALGERDRCLGFLYLGYPIDPTCWPESKRGSIKAKITHTKN